MPQAPLELAPRRGNWFSESLGRLVLALLGWRIEGQLSPVPRCVMIAAPHTSNWDFVVGISAMLALRLRVSWLGKGTIFRFPFRKLLRFLGGIPVDRHVPDGVVGAAVARFRQTPQLYVALAPEGTRRKVERWKTGFHRIARGAGVPLFLVTLDYRTRTLQLGPLYETGPDFEADERELKARFVPAMAYHPDNY